VFGSCTLFAASAALESAMAILKGKKNLDLSEQELFHSTVQKNQVMSEDLVEIDKVTLTNAKNSTAKRMRQAMDTKQQLANADQVG
jgi:hypothetical protein